MMKIELTAAATYAEDGKDAIHYWQRNIYTIDDLNFHERTATDKDFSGLVWNTLVSTKNGQVAFVKESYDDIRRTLIHNGFCLEVDTLLADDEEGEYGADGDADYEGDGEDIAPGATGPSARELLSYDDPRETGSQDKVLQSLSQAGVGTSGSAPVPPSSSEIASEKTATPAPDQQ